MLSLVKALGIEERCSRVIVPVGVGSQRFFWKEGALLVVTETRDEGSASRVQGDCGVDAANETSQIILASKRL